MKYKLNYYNDFNKSMLFWLYKFMRYKMSTLSNRLVTDKIRFEEILAELRNEKDLDMISLKKIVKEARNIGMTGINLFIIPLEKLYYFFERNKFDILEDIDEELIIEFLTSNTSTLSDDSKKNYRNVMINFFKYIDKNNVYKEDISYKFEIELKQWNSRNKKERNYPLL